MDYKGYCLWASDIPSQEAPHYIIVVSNQTPNKEYLVVVISSIKYREDGTTKYYDPACVLSVDDIKDGQGKNVLTKPSFIRYQFALAMPVNMLLEKQIFAGYTVKCQISDTLLQRIQEGARESKELPIRLKRFFDYF